MEEFVLKTEPRKEFGSKAARRLRRAGLLPANIYGHKEANAAVSLDGREFRRFFEAGHRIAVLELDGGREHGVIKEVQYDSLGSEILHVDFTRITRGEKIELEVPLETVGVVLGGVVDLPHRELRIRGEAHQIPERIEVHIADLKIGDAIRVKNIAAPPGCEVLDDPELVVVAVHAPKGLEEALPEAAPAEPEVVRRKEESSGD